MNRRRFGTTGLAALASVAVDGRIRGSSAAGPRASEDPHSTIPKGKPQQVAMVVYPQMTALDLVGPQSFLAGLGNIEVHLVWKDREPVTTDTGFQIIPSKTVVDCPTHLDVLFIGGGTQGTLALLQDRSILEFLAEQGRSARFVTSVCTGSIVLGAAGLLRGYKATSHWAFRDVLPKLGAELAPGRVVQDRNRITAGGVTAGIEFGLTLAALLRNRTYAEMLQLAFEYDPHPPFQSGNRDTAPKSLVSHLQAMYAPDLKAFLIAAERAAERMAAFIKSSKLPLVDAPQVVGATNIAKVKVDGTYD